MVLYTNLATVFDVRKLKLYKVSEFADLKFDDTFKHFGTVHDRQTNGQNHHNNLLPMAAQAWVRGLSPPKCLSTPTVKHAGQ